MISSPVRAASGVRMPKCIRWIRRHCTTLCLAVALGAFAAIPGRFLFALISGVFA